MVDDKLDQMKEIIRSIFADTQHEAGIFIPESEMLECAALSRAMLIATSAPTGTTLQVPSPFGSENLIPHYRLLLATDDEYSDGMQVFVLSSETNKSSSSERVRCGEYENPPIPEMLGNRAMHEPHPEKKCHDDSYWFVEKETKLEVNVNELYKTN